MDCVDGNCMTKGHRKETTNPGATRNHRSHTSVQTASDDDEFYKMSHKKRGIALIFNHIKFIDPKLPVRVGSNVDGESLIATLKNFGFKVEQHKDFSFRKIRHHIHKAAEMDHSEHDCIIIVVLTHGELNIINAYDSPYKPNELWEPFTEDKCKSLKGKPKLFFIQACQGEKFDPGITLRRTQMDSSATEQLFRVISHPDFLIAFSTVPGFYSWRNQARGSWFIEALCIELNANGCKLDILTLLTFVSQRVALNYESNVPPCINSCGDCIKCNKSRFMHMQKQVPYFSSMLTRRLKFTKPEMLNT